MKNTVSQWPIMGENGQQSGKISLEGEGFLIQAHNVTLVVNRREAASLLVQLSQALGSDLPDVRVQEYIILRCKDGYKRKRAHLGRHLEPVKPKYEFPQWVTLCGTKVGESSWAAEVSLGKLPSERICPSCLRSLQANRKAEELGTEPPPPTSMEVEDRLLEYLINNPRPLPVTDDVGQQP